MSEARMYLKSPDWAVQLRLRRHKKSLMATWGWFIDDDYLDLRMFEGNAGLYVGESHRYSVPTDLPVGVYRLTFTGGYHEDWDSGCSSYATKNENVGPDERQGVIVRLRLDVHESVAYLTVEKS